MSITDKPLMAEKLMDYVRKTEVAGHQKMVRGFQLNYSNKCNFNC
jgi:2-iminoacetate synthase ThiH